MTALVLREDLDEGITILTLNRPEALNALSPNLFVELRAHLEAIAPETERIGVIVLGGAGRSFSAGADLKARQRGETAPSRYHQFDTVRFMETMPQPILVSVQGHCWTGGLELALGGDLIIAADTADFADTHGKWGMVAGWGLGQRLSRRVGPSRAKQLMYTAKPVSAAEAERFGLVNYVVPEAELETATMELARTMAGISWFTLRGDKKLVNGGQEYTLAEGLEFEKTVMGYSPDSAQRVSTFGGKN